MEIIMALLLGVVLLLVGLVVWLIYEVIMAIYRKTLRYETLYANVVLE